MMLTARLILQVALPGFAGFLVSKTVLIPQVMAMAPHLPKPELLTIIATGLLTFALAAVLRGWSVPLLLRLRSNHLAN